jgi:chaperone modulatory protein CbpM
MTLREQDVLRSITGLTRIRLETWIQRGWVMPTRSESGYIYTEIDIARCNLIRELEDELEIDHEALPVVLSLLDQLYGLRRELRVIIRAIEKQPRDVRSQILDLIQQKPEDE